MYFADYVCPCVLQTLPGLSWNSLSQSCYLVRQSQKTYVESGGRHILLPLHATRPRYRVCQVPGTILPLITVTEHPRSC